MKKVTIITVIFALALLYSCMELDQFNPNAPTAESFWQSEGDLYTGLMGAYAQLQERYYGGGNYNAVSLCMSDVATVIRKSGELYNPARFLEEPWEFEWWSRSYKLIF